MKINNALNNGRYILIVSPPNKGKFLREPYFIEKKNKKKQGMVAIVARNHPNPH